MHAEQLERFEDQPARDAGSPSSGQAPYRPESPFLPEPEYAREPNHSPILGPSADARHGDVIETPFISQYELNGVATESPELALHREIMEELHDDEFDEAVEDLVNAVREAYEDRYRGEIDHGSMEAERQMWTYLAPLDRELNGAIDRLVEGLVQIDNELLSDEQLEHYLDNFEYRTDFEQPEFEAFFGKIWKKVKKVAKKGLKTLKKLSPLHIILGKLKKLVRPLLRRVLKFALNKIPPRFRPLAKKLARRFFKGALGEVAESEFDGELLAFEDFVERSEMEALDADAAAPSSSAIGAELDSLIAGYLIDGESFDYDPAVAQYLNEEQLDDEDATDVLDRARDRFAREIGAVESEAEAIAEIERFIPAVLMGLKVGIKLIGRKRVVNFLAKLIAKLIGKYVGKQASVPLSRALVDAGLRLVSLESPEDAAYAGGEILADTVRDTVDEYVANAPQEALDDEELMQLYVQEAFERAVAKNFPPRLVRTDLRQDPTSHGMWLALPRGRRRKRYKKFTEIFDVKITPQLAKRVHSFAGQSLYSFLKDQLGQPIDRRDVNARMHLYEGIRGTSLSDISHLERGVDGLGARDRSAWLKIHPLTPEAAAALLPEHMGLARPTDPRFLADRTRTSIGQRFYYLEVPGARVVRAPAPPAEKVGSGRSASPVPARGSEVGVTIDFKAREIRVYDYVSEVEATEIAQAIRRGQSRMALVRSIRKTLASALRTVFSGSSGGHLRIRREVPTAEGMLAGLAPLLRFAGPVLAEQIGHFVVKELLATMKKDGQAFAREFVDAADAAADGVTVTFTLSRIGPVFDVLSANVLERVKSLAKFRSAGISGSMTVAVKAGFHRG